MDTGESIKKQDTGAKGKFSSPVWRILKWVCIALVLFLAFALLSFDFYDNRWKVVYDQEWFEAWEWDSQGLVESKVLSAREEGIFFERGLLTRYPSQMGLQGQVYSAIDLLTGQPDKIFNYLQFGTCAMLAALLVLLAVWFWREFGVVAGIFCYGAAFYSHWLVGSGRNLYWAIWTLFLPFIAMLFLFWSEKLAEKKWFLPVAGAVAFLTCFIRFGCGFEYTTVVLVALEVPLVYYAYRRKWSWRRYLKSALVVGLCALGAFVVVLAINLWQQVGFYGSFEVAWQNFLYTVTKRTGAFNVPLEEVYVSSLSGPMWGLFKTYFSGGPMPLIRDYRMDVVLGCFVLVFMLSWLDKDMFPTLYKNKRKVHAICFAAFVSLAGQFSWIILAKGHSQIHRHINYVLWSIPCMLLMFAAAGAIFAYMGRDAFPRLYLRAKNSWWPALKGIPEKWHSRKSAVKKG